MNHLITAIVITTLHGLLLAPAQAQDWAKEKLEKSPRHGEWVEVAYGDRKIRSFLIYPEVKEKAPAVVVIHEIFGLTEWVRSVADQLAERGYIAIAPDLLSGDSAETKTFSDIDEARKAIAELPDEQVIGDLHAAADYVAKLSAATGKVAVTGFCWGGAKVWDFANARRDLAAAYVFYGTGPTEAEGVENIPCPVYGFYAENDARVNTTISKTEELMKSAGKKFEYKIYENAGHGFMRAGEAPDASEGNRAAREQAWEWWRELLKKL